MYLLLCVLGAVLPYSQFIPWIIEHGPNIELLFRQLFANRISGFFGWDVLVSAVVLVTIFAKVRSKDYQEQLKPYRQPSLMESRYQQLPDAKRAP